MLYSMGENPPKLEMFNILQGFDHLQFAHLAYNTEKIWQESNFCGRYGGEFCFKFTQENNSQIMHLWKSFSVLVQLDVDFPMKFDLADLTFWSFFPAVYPCSSLPVVSPRQFLSLHHCTSVCGIKYSSISPSSMVWKKSNFC